jgi:hypothetical protein
VMIPRRSELGNGLCYKSNGVIELVLVILAQLCLNVQSAQE